MLEELLLSHFHNLNNNIMLINKAIPPQMSQTCLSNGTICGMFVSCDYSGGKLP